MAAAATGLGFLAFVPTRYHGVSELGLTAGLGMFIAVLLTVTFLPALLSLLPPGAPTAEGGLRALRHADAAVARHRRAIVFGAGGLALVCLIVAPALRFNFDPLRLRNPNTESVAAFLDLARDPETTPNTLDGFAPSLGEATALAARLKRQPQVREVVTLASFVPADQEAKLALLRDANQILDPTLDPFDIAEAPKDTDLVASLRSTAAALRSVPPPLEPAIRGDPAKRLAGLLDVAAESSPAQRAQLQIALVGGLPVALDQLRAMLKAERVTTISLPAEVKEDWVSSDGHARVQAFPAGRPGDELALKGFVRSVRAVMPNAVGSPIAVGETQRLILHAFGEAGALSLLAMTALLLAALRRWGDVLLSLAPVLLTAALTVGTCVFIGEDINLENLIALPLLAGIGVSFSIYFVVAHRSGAACVLASSVTRAILYSALTTGLAFAALSLSKHPGSASMGALLLVSLSWTLVTTLIVLPALWSLVTASPPAGEASP